MALLRHHFLRVLLAILTLSAFAGDLIGDAFSDGHETALAQVSNGVPSDRGDCSDNDSCPACCAVHGGAVILSQWGFQVAISAPAENPFVVLDEHAPSGDPVPIEYPPRFA